MSPPGCANAHETPPTAATVFAPATRKSRRSIPTASFYDERNLRRARRRPHYPVPGHRIVDIIEKMISTWVRRILLCTLPGAAGAQPIDSDLFHDLHWRNVGPFRGGRTRAAVGVPSQPNLFYMGQVNGGVGKSDDYGRTWTPIFDSQPTGSIGAIAVAPSDPNVIYVASGEGLQRPDLSVGNGIYKSTDAGRTWTHLGLRDGQQIPALAVDPRDANHLFAAVLGHPYGANEERGVFVSTDGGQTWRKAFYIDENTGASDIAMDPTNPDVLYASMWESREAAWEFGNEYSGTHGGIFKSTDGGKTWNKLTKGLPEVS